MLQFLSAGASAGGPSSLVSFLPLVGMVLIFWFLLIRPQMKRQKEHQAKVTGMKRGDQVVTGGGLVGKVIKVDDNYAEIELAQGVRVKALKHTVSDVVAPGAGAAND
jgi:preprotein translocase subunit YajC